MDSGAVPQFMYLSSGTLFASFCLFTIHPFYLDNIFPSQKTFLIYQACSIMSA